MSKYTKYYFQVWHSTVPKRFTLFGIIVSFTIGFIVGITAFCVIHDIVMSTI